MFYQSISLIRIEEESRDICLCFFFFYEAQITIKDRHLVPDGKRYGKVEIIHKKRIERKTNHNVEEKISICTNQIVKKKLTLKI